MLFHRFGSYSRERTEWQSVISPVVRRLTHRYNFAAMRKFLNILIVTLTLGTAVTHLYLGIRDDYSRLFRALYLLNGVGYLVLLIPLFAQRLVFMRYRATWHITLILYTTVTVLAYIYTHSAMLWMTRLESINKINEVALIVVLTASLIMLPRTASAPVKTQ